MRPKIKIKFIYLFKMSITFSQNRQQVNVITNDLQILTKIFFKIEIPALPEGFWWGNAIELHVLKNTMIDISIDSCSLDKKNIPGWCRDAWNILNNTTKNICYDEIKKQSLVNQICYVPIWHGHNLNDMYGNNHLDHTFEVDVSFTKENLENLILYLNDKYFNELNITLDDIKITLLEEIFV